MINRGGNMRIILWCMFAPLIHYFDQKWAKTRVFVDCRMIIKISHAVWWAHPKNLCLEQENHFLITIFNLVMHSSILLHQIGLLSKQCLLITASPKYRSSCFCFYFSSCFSNRWCKRDKKVMKRLRYNPFDGLLKVLMHYRNFCSLPHFLSNINLLVFFLLYFSLLWKDLRIKAFWVIC